MTENNDKDKEYELPDEDFELSGEDLKKLQHQDAIEKDESYDVDMEEKKVKPQVSEEKVEPVPPPDYHKKQETFYDDIDAKYTLDDDEYEDGDDEPSYEPPTFEDSKKLTDLDSGEEKDASKREYLSRKDTIYNDPDIFIPEPPRHKPKPKSNPVKALPGPVTKVPIDSTIATGVATLFFVFLIVFCFLITWRLMDPGVKLTEIEKQNVVELSTFLSYNEEYIKGINELSDQKRTLLESYIKGVRNQKELALELLAIRNKEIKIQQIFADDKWTFESVRVSQDMTNEFISSNIDTTNGLVKLLGDNAEKGQILNYYNDSVTTHSSQLYTINEYVKARVNELGVDSLIEENVIQIDLTNVKF